MQPAMGLTARAAVLTALMVLVALGAIVLALSTFSRYRDAVAFLADRQAQVLVTTSRLLQQSEGMVASTAMLMLAEDHLSRRQAMFEIADRKEWIGRLVEDLAELRDADEHFAPIYHARDRLVERLEVLDELVSQRINLRVSLREANAEGAIPDVLPLARLAQVEAEIAEEIRTTRTLSMDLSVAVGYHLAAARQESQRRVDVLAEEARHSEALLKASGLAVLLVVMATVAFIHHSVVGRVTRLEQALRRERPLPEEINTGGHDEIARMANTIHRYVDRINHNEQRILTMNRELDFLASHDGLTRLHNRRHFDQTVTQHAEMLQAQGYCAAMVDIDHFKQVNDRYGHAVGDRVITHVAGLLRDGLTEDALLARYGGEEFAVVLPGMTPAAALECLERIRRRIAASPLRVENQQIPVTVSIGLSPQLPSGEVEHCLRSADESLYRAKRSGRNRLVLRAQRAGDAMGERA